MAALGLPLLFVLYLRESDADDDLPVSALVLTSMLGIGLAVGWVLLTGTMVAKAYSVELGAAVVGARMVRMGIMIPAGGVILMLMPAVIMRVLRPWLGDTREALDGFMIGALGALMFSAAGR